MACAPFQPSAVAAQLAPAGASIAAAPHTIGTGAKQQHLAIIGVDGKPLAIGPAQFVAAQLEWQLGTLEAAALVVRAQDGAIAAACMQVSTHRQIQSARVGWIHRHAFHAEAALVLCAHPIQQRLPALLCRIPTVGAADIGARVLQPRLLRVEHQAGNKATAADGDVVPGVFRLRTSMYCRYPSQGWQQQHRCRQPSPQISCAAGSGVLPATHCIEAPDTCHTAPPSAHAAFTDPGWPGCSCRNGDH